MSDDAYEPGSPKRTDYTGTVCALCGASRGHYMGCPEVTR